MIIGISGKMQSGKDTIGIIIQYLTSDYVNRCDFETYLEHIIDFPEWKIKKFAGKLKEIVSILTGMPVEDLEKQEVKDRVLGEEWDYKSDFIDLNGRLVEKNILNNKYTYRSLLQKIGTEAMRDVIHPNIWCNALFADYTTKKYSIGIDKYGHQTIIDKYPNWIVTDVRFPNELQAIKDRGGITIRVNRFMCSKCGNTDNFERDNDLCNECGHFKSDDKEHESETALDNAEFNYIIDNNGTIEELVVKVKEILIKEQIL